MEWHIWKAQYSYVLGGKEVKLAKTMADIWNELLHSRGSHDRRKKFLNIWDHKDLFFHPLSTGLSWHFMPPRLLFATNQLQFLPP